VEDNVGLVVDILDSSGRFFVQCHGCKKKRHSNFLFYGFFFKCTEKEMISIEFTLALKLRV
jgi:hypothetical protein